MDNFSPQQAVESARALRRDILEFEEKFPLLPSEQTQMPRFTWAQLERQLEDLSRVSTCSRDQVRSVIAMLRLKALSAPPELLLRELLVAASILLEEDLAEDLSADS